MRCSRRTPRFFFDDTPSTEIYTLSLHDALPIFVEFFHRHARRLSQTIRHAGQDRLRGSCPARSEEHTSELQSRQYLVCRLLLEKKKTRRHLTLYQANNDVSSSCRDHHQPSAVLL